MTSPPSNAPMRFLEQFVPGARDAGAVVRAALPSRFAPSEAPSLFASETPSLFKGETLAVQPDDRHAAPESVTTPSSTSRAERAAPVVAPTAAEVVRRTMMQPASEMASPDPTPRAPLDLEEAIGKASTGVPSSAVVASASTPPQPHMRGAAGANPSRPREAWTTRDKPDASAESTTKPLAAMARPAVAVRAPLRESAVARRAAPARGETPTIVHVTIDRVDVRAPPAPAFTQRLDQKPRAMSTVSLSDYLRQRDRARNGGSSS